MARSAESAVVARLDRELPDLLRQHRIPGLAIGICTGAEVIWAVGFGTATGEVLDLTQTPPTLANVPLNPTMAQADLG